MAENNEEQKLFTLKEAEQTRLEVEPLLIEAMECRRKAADLQEDLSELASRIMMSGGMVVSYAKAARTRAEHDKLNLSIQAALERIHSTGCLVKDLEMGLLDFPAVLDNEDIYLCWRLGEDRIRFYHRQDEGFSGRKPLDPRDTGPGIQ